MTALALLAKVASHGYQLRARLELALGPPAEALNAGHVYVTLEDTSSREAIELDG